MNVGLCTRFSWIFGREGGLVGGDLFRDKQSAWVLSADSIQNGWMLIDRRFVRSKSGVSAVMMVGMRPVFLRR